MFLQRSADVLHTSNRLLVSKQLLQLQQAIYMLEMINMYLVANLYIVIVWELYIIVRDNFFFLKKKYCFKTEQIK